jgi:hypothetical protein
MRLVLPCLVSLSLVIACSSLPEDDFVEPAPTPGVDRGGRGGGGGGDGEQLEGDTDGGVPIPDGPPVYASGTRLKARWAETEDGYRAFVGWHDAERKGDCRIVTAADGKRRCLPADSLQMGSRFSDASCTKPAVQVLTGGSCAVPSTAARFDAASRRTRVYERGAKSATGYFKIGDGACIASNPVNAEDYVVGAEIPASSFVEMTSIDPPAEPGVRITERYLEGSDGSHEFVGWRDQDFESWCTFGTASDGSHRCLPFSALGGDYFRDGSCQEPVVTFDLSRTDTPLFAYIPSASCTKGHAYYKVGKGVPGDNLSQRSGATCAPATTARKAWAIHEVPPKELAAPFVVADTVGRIRGSSFVSPEEGKRVHRGFVDTTLGGAKCTFETALDGKVRCVPEAMISASGFLYSDAACTKRIDIGDVRKGTCDVPRYARGSQDSCTKGYALFEVKPYTGELFVKTGTCTKYTGMANRDLFEMGAEVPVATFAEGSIVVDP